MAIADEVYEIAASLTGSDSEHLADLCSAALAELTGRLRAGVSQEDCREALVQAAALLTMSMHSAAAMGADGVESYSAGDVSVKRKSSAELSAYARGLREQAEMIMAPYTDDRGFAFKGVRG
ncbi:MAG: hypothetical protein IJG63_08275 [Oscillospiraceae bacterium]|nr:hypothetical protein [Oscillospiraceae bacterium]